MDLFCSLSLFRQKYSKILLVLLSISFFVNNLLPAKSDVDKNWRAFGYGVLDSVSSEDGQQIDIHVDWKSATWGIGCIFTIDSNADIKEAKEIRFQAWTDNGSKIKVYAEIETFGEAILVYPEKLAKPVDSKPQEFRIPLAKMRRSKPGSPPRRFNKTDEAYAPRIKILFKKPEGLDSPWDIIHISKPEIVYPELLADKVQSPDNKEKVLSAKKAPSVLPKQAIPSAIAAEPAKENTPEMSQLSKESQIRPPLVVGTGVKDWGTVEQKDQIFVAVKWSQSTEGVAIRFKLPPKSTSELPERLKFEIRTAYNSYSDIRMRVMSGSDRTIYKDPKWRPKVTANWREYAFNISDYPDERSLLEYDDSNSRFVEILVRKPVANRSVPDYELILIRNPRLVEFDPSLEILADTTEEKKFDLIGTTADLLQPLGKSVTIQGSYNFDYSYNASGGIKTGSSSRSFFDINLTLDLQSALNWENGTASIGFQKYSGDDATDLVGDFQGTGSNDGPDVEILSELWVERFFLENTLRLKVGKVDANSEFAFVDNGAEFVNAALGITSPTISVLPTSPHTAVSANLFVYPYENIYGGFGIYDGATQSGRSTGTHGLDSIFRDPGSLFFIGEVGGSWISGEDKRPNRLGVGVWRHNANFERFDGGSENGAEGFYVVFDKSLWTRTIDQSDNRQSLNTFLQYGYASGTISEVKQHLGSGLVMTNPLGNRAEDLSGIGFTWVDFTDEPAAGFDDSFELIIECFYKVQFNSFLSIKTDFQYVVNPGGDSDLDNAGVPGIRVEASF